jgi:hypothetical protein
LALVAQHLQIQIVKTERTVITAFFHLLQQRAAVVEARGTLLVLLVVLVVVVAEGTTRRAGPLLRQVKATPEDHLKMTL